MVLNIKKIIFTLLIVTTVFSSISSYGEDDKYLKTRDWGGRGGNSFDWKSDYPDYKLKEIYYTEGQRGLDSYQMVYYYKDKMMRSPVYGNPSSHPKVWKVPDGEFIVKIEYRQGSWLDGITFVTNKGTKSPQFGGHGGNGPFTYVIPAGQRLAGIYGHKDQYIRGM